MTGRGRKPEPDKASIDRQIAALIFSRCKNGSSLNEARKAAAKAFDTSLSRVRIVWRAEKQFPVRTETNALFHEMQLIEAPSQLSERLRASKTENQRVKKSRGK